jgi:hypothetical protein
MEHAHVGDVASDSISIARCRELQPDKADGLSPVVVDTVPAADRGLGTARADLVRHCEACNALFQGRPDKRFCRGACRARFSREQKAREVQATIDRLARLAGVEP